MKKLALHWKIIIGMVLGVVYGLVANNLGWVDFTDAWIKPWGVIFVNLLKLIAVPLVFASLIKGVASLSDISRLSRIGGKTIAIYLVSTVISVTIGLLLVNMVNPGADFDKDSIQLTENSQSGADKKIADAGNVKEAGSPPFVLGILAANIFLALNENSNMFVG
ncbi:MAG: cation:dicarboxylase symporter family transporter, partial [Cryomorphaceae bacterium]|nr:cation:dicarboxylase symporter family transporter [Cryomorphaceae bacterium]